MKPYQYNLKVWEGGETSRTWHFEYLREIDEEDEET